MLTALAIEGYRSLRHLRLTLGALTVVTGANGSGKSSLYRALRLLAEVAQGRVVQTLAIEGGIQSALWAGPEKFSRAAKEGGAVEGTLRRNAVALKLGFGGDDYGYAIDLGYPIPGKTFFNFDPAIKAEALWTGAFLGRANAIAERKGPGVRIRDANGVWAQAVTDLSALDSMMTHAGDPSNAVELLMLRDRMRAWRFYDHFRTDADAPARRTQVGTYTPVLAHDGADLAAALQTILEIGEGGALAAAIEDAFPGGRIEIEEERGLFQLAMRQHGLLRPLRAAELSDGTLRYLLLVAALLSPRPPALMVLNEPESSLHPDLLPALARLIGAAAIRGQVIVVTHALPLVAALERQQGCVRITLRKELGETHAEQDQDGPRWSWPGR